MYNPHEEVMTYLARIEAQYARIEKLLTDRQPEPTPTTRRPLNIQEAAELVRMKKGSIYGLIHKRQIPFIKRGKSVLFDHDELVKWLESGRIETTSEIEQSARKSRQK